MKDSAFVFITCLTQSRMFGQTKKCAEFKKNKEAVRNSTVASEMAREQNDMPSKMPRSPCLLNDNEISY